MKRTWLAGVLTGAGVGLVALVLTESIQAQGPRAATTGRVACVDVIRAFNEYQRQKDLTEEMNGLQTQVEDENKRRRQAIDALDAELSAMDPSDPTLTERTREMLKTQIEYKNWADMKQADLSREIALWSVKIYGEIRAAIEEVARHEGYDMVLYRGEFEQGSWDPQVIKEQIRSLHLLYANPSIDITQIVIDKLNIDYRAQPQVKMMYVP